MIAAALGLEVVQHRTAALAQRDHVQRHHRSVHSEWAAGLKADGGDVLIRGRRIGGLSCHALCTLRRGIGVMFQDGAVFSSMNVYDDVAFPLLQHSDLHRGGSQAIRRPSSVGRDARVDRGTGGGVLKG